MRLFLLTLILAGSLQAKPEYWNQFRGPNGDGDATDADLPLTFGEDQHVVWKTPVAGKAWSSPVVLDGHVWITNALENGHKMWAVCLDFETGKKLHEVIVFENKKPQFCHKMNSYATPTPVIEGGRVFVHFGTYGTAALDAKTGKKLWERRNFKCNHYRGPAASPISFEKSIIVQFDGYDVQYVVALDQATGKTLWRKDRAFRLQDQQRRQQEGLLHPCSHSPRQPPRTRQSVGRGHRIARPTHGRAFLDRPNGRHEQFLPSSLS